MAMFHGRGVAGVERKTRLTRAEREKRRKIVAVVAVLSVAFLYLGAWLWAAFDAVGIDHFDLFGEWLLSNPFPFARIDDDALLGCVCWGVIAALVPWVYYSMWVRRQGNYDPGAEHGDSRLASPEDFDDIADSELPSNNIKFTTHVWMSVKLRSKKAARSMSALNLNALVIGTSGGGKTSAYAKPLIMSSCGTRLCPGGVGPSGIADEGFDLVFTDTKGDVLPDVGHALVNSGADVRCFNIRDPERSDRLNPFHYIHVSSRDAIKPSGKTVEVTATVDGRPAILDVAAQGDGAGSLELSVDGGQVLVAGLGGAAGEERDPWICPACGGINPPDAEECETPGCGRAREAQGADAVVAFFAASSFAVGGASGVALRVRLRNRSRGAGPAVAVRVEAKLPRGVYLHSAHVPGTDESVGDLLMTPEGEPVFRWDALIEPGAALAADVEAIVEKVTEVSGSMLTRICTCIVSNLNATEDGAKEDPFWPKCATMNFQGNAGLLLEVWGKRYCTLPRVMDNVLAMEVDPQDAAKDSIDLLMEAWETGYMPAPPSDDPFAPSVAASVPCDVRDMSPIEVLEDGYWRLAPGQRWLGPHDRSQDPALSAYYSYRKGAPETRQSVLITSAATLSSIMSPTMRRLLSEDTLHLEDLGDGKGAHVLSIISHDQDKTFKPLVALVFFLTLLQLDENATSRPGARLPRHVHILADEFKNLGKLPEIDGALSTVRSKNVSVSMCVQSVDQLDGTYGEHVAAELRDNCATIVFMGGSNEKTLKSFETLSGTETVDMIQTSRSFGTSGQTTESRQAVQRPVVSVGQLRTCPPTHAYVLMKGKPAFRDWKTGYGAYDFYEWIDPTREDRGCSKGRRKFTELFDFARYKEDRDAGRAPYDYDESLKGMPAAWAPQDAGKREEA